MALRSIDTATEVERLKSRLRRAEAERDWFREREERVTAALTAGQVGIYDHDPRRKLISWDKSARAFWGLPEGEAVTYDAFLEGIHPHDRAATHEAVQASLDPKVRRPHFIEFRVINKQDGTVHWLRSRGRVTFRDGIATRIVGTVMDVTEKIWAQRTLSRREARLQAVLSAACLGAWHWNIQTGVVEMNAMYAEMLGYELDELDQTFTTFQRLLHPDDAPKVWQAVERHFNGEQDSVSFEFRLRHKEGYWVWILSTGRLIERDERGRPLIMTGTHQNICARVAQRHALEESEARFRETFENASVGMAHLSFDGQWLRVNERLCRVLGYERDEMLALTFHEITHPDDLEADAAQFDALMRGEIPSYQIQKRLFARQGEIVWVEASVSIQRDAEGKPLYGISVIKDISGQIFAEEARRRSEERLAAALKGGKLGVYDYDPRTGRLEWDQAVRSIWGVSLDEPITYETLAAGVHPDDLPGVEEILEAALDFHDERTFAAEFRVVNRRSGEVRWVRAEGDATFERATPVRLVGTIYDITRQKGAEDALRESEARFRHMADHAPVIVWVTNGKGICTYLSRKWFELTGQTKEEGYGFGWLDAVHPDDRQNAKEIFLDANSGREPFHLEYRLRDRSREDGWRWHLTVAQPRMSEAGRFLGFIGSSIDIDERKEIEFALQESEAQFRLMADNIHQLAWMTDAEGWIYWYNKRWFDYTGSTLEEMQGWGWRKVHHPDHVDRVVESISRSFQTGEPWEDTFPLRGRDGKYRWFLSRALPVRDENGRVVRWFGTNTDITERLEADEHRELLVNELNHRVKNSLAIVQGIAQQTFRNAGEAARRANRAFQRRLVALGTAHSLLTERNWQATTLEELARKTLKTGCAPQAPVFIKGPEVWLEPKQAISFAMALHELCTNAVKYGALSVETGRVDLFWTLPEGSGKRFRLIWKERGGPPVEPPRHRGFGSRMIEEALARELNGAVAMDFRPEGLVCTIEGNLQQTEGTV